MGIFGKNILFLDLDYHLKIPHALTLIFSEVSNKYHQDRKNFAPEINQIFSENVQINKERIDVWMLGTILFELLTGLPLFEIDSWKLKF